MPLSLRGGSGCVTSFAKRVGSLTRNTATSDLSTWRITNGARRWTLTRVDFSNFHARAGEHGISGLPCWSSTRTLETVICGAPRPQSPSLPDRLAFNGLRPISRVSLRPCCTTVADLPLRSLPVSPSPPRLSAESNSRAADRGSICWWVLLLSCNVVHLLSRFTLAGRPGLERPSLKPPALGVVNHFLQGGYRARIAIRPQIITEIYLMLQVWQEREFKF